MRGLELIGWLAVAVGLCALAIPWFLWGNDATVAGLPVWLWWHVGWMGLASLIFWYFSQRAWGLGIEPRSRSDASSSPQATRDDARPPSGGDAP
ncbi:DUF3311 domain-containing protein [Halopiger thermotolerans]